MKLPLTLLRRLRSIPPFAHCTDDELDAVARNTCDHHAEPGSVLTRAGSTGREWILVVSGTAVVRVGGRDVAHLGPGDAVGEIALLDHGPRTATVVAETHVEALVASAAEFDRLVDEVPAMSRLLLIGLARRLRHADEAIGHHDALLSVSP